MVGLIGQWPGIHAGERLGKPLLSSAAAKCASDDVWNSKINIVLQGGRRAMSCLLVAARC
jgi:3-oxoadipate enol-lactonase